MKKYYTDILNAYKKARKSRKNKEEVYMFDQNIEERIIKIKNDIDSKSYIHSRYKEIVLKDSKKRYIYSPFFRDHILHHLIYENIYDKVDRNLVHCTFACRKGYGTQKAVKYLLKIIKKESKINGIENLFYLKIDFSKYFFSINHELLKNKFRKIFKDIDLLYLIDLVIDSYKSPGKYDDLLQNHSFYINEQNKGLPIGGILSQIFANFYLNDLDKFLKHKLKLNFVRYMDDIVIIGNKNDLNNALVEIFKFIKGEKLILNPKKISFNKVSDSVSFVGYKIKDFNIFVGKSIKKSLINFVRRNSFIKKVSLDKNDIFRINSAYYSRLGFFRICKYGENYLNNIIK